ncbi:type II toxin-antitoxin system prevent-host-death family antitoxin [Actinophytocola sp.]|uniref:type II toxin-antitoxin system prevent-host-death family antitoxin n=1 Tax=Actinophytocola sp. TaxID=1872138 RepID=UPI002D809AE2|nr:type II toxin-antitoxin system prevent-host-death family antitoxin [Actinophytocola sp.]HET9140507.1 type II toxin-antitoxin system prevent-host-death family antitoxin [Actinophytocola sp.]
MRSMTTAEASANFAALLAAAEHGETIVVTRDGVPVGRFVPERSVAERIAEVLDRYPLSPEAAEDLARTIEENRALMNAGDSVRQWPID